VVCPITAVVTVHQQNQQNRLNQLTQHLRSLLVPDLELLVLESDILTVLRAAEPNPRGEDSEFSDRDSDRHEKEGDSVNSLEAAVYSIEVDSVD